MKTIKQRIKEERELTKNKVDAPIIEVYEKTEVYEKAEEIKAGSDYEKNKGTFNEEEIAKEAEDEYVVGPDGKEFLVETTKPEDLTVKELRELAETNKVEFKKSWTKTKLINAIWGK